MCQFGILVAQCVMFCAIQGPFNDEKQLVRNANNFHISFFRICTHSFILENIWRNLTSAAGLIGGNGRWDVRFRSINQFLRYLRSTFAGSPYSGASLGLQTASVSRGRCLVDHDGLTCLIVLLVASSSCSQQRRHIIPTVKKVSTKAKTLLVLNANFFIIYTFTVVNKIADFPQFHVLEAGCCDTTARFY